jgi:hypothetical protein
LVRLIINRHIVLTDRGVKNLGFPDIFTGRSERRHHRGNSGEPLRGGQGVSAGQQKRSALDVERHAAHCARAGPRGAQQRTHGDRRQKRRIQYGLFWILPLCQILLARIACKWSHSALLIARLQQQTQYRNLN